MSYGSFKNGKGTSVIGTNLPYNYDCYKYTEGGVEYIVHIFKTNPATTGISGMTSTTRKNLVDLDPPSTVCSPSKVIARINGNYLDTKGTIRKSFYGMFYAGGVLSYDGRVGITSTDNDFSNSMYNENYWRVSPSLGINTATNTALIRWPNYYGGTNLLTPTQMTEQFNVIVAGQHCLVHNSKSVFESVCYSWEGVRIADWSALDNHYNHHNEDLGGGNSKLRRARTFFGHAPNGACYLVCVEGDHDDGGEGSSGMLINTGARLMCDLGCDYAINMDGGSPTQMRVDGGIVYSRMGDGSYPVGSGICAYYK